MPSLQSYLLVGLGSFVGGTARFWCTGWVAARWGAAFPWGTLLVNVLGSFLIGVLAAFSETEGRWLLPVTVRELLMVGVLGGYTTFSAFSLQTFSLLHAGQWLRAGGNVLLSVGLCLTAVMVGYLVAQVLNHTRA